MVGGHWHCPYAGAHCPLRQADLIGKSLIKLLTLTRLLNEQHGQQEGGSAPASLAKGFVGGQHCMALAQPGAPVPKGDLIPVPKPLLCSGAPSMASAPCPMGHPSSEPPGTSAMRAPGLCCPPPNFTAARGFGTLVPSNGAATCVPMRAQACTRAHTLACSPISLLPSPLSPNLGRLSRPLHSLTTLPNPYCKKNRGHRKPRRPGR